jgi:hypothetical protein
LPPCWCYHQQDFRIHSSIAVGDNTNSGEKKKFLQFYCCLRTDFKRWRAEEIEEVEEVQEVEEVEEVEEIQEVQEV